MLAKASAGVGVMWGSEFRAKIIVAAILSPVDEV